MLAITHGKDYRGRGCFEFRKLSNARNQKPYRGCVGAVCLKIEGFHMTCTVQNERATSLLKGRSNVGLPELGSLPHSATFPCPRASAVSCKVLCIPEPWIG